MVGDAEEVPLMPASREEIQLLADQILEALDLRIRAGTLTIFFNDNLVQRVEAGTVFTLRRGAHQNLLDQSLPKGSS